MHVGRLRLGIVVAFLGIQLSTAGATLGQGVPRSPDADQSRGMLFDSTLVLPYWTRALVFDCDLRTSSGDGSHYEAHWNSLTNGSTALISDGKVVYRGWLGRERFDSDQHFWSAVAEDLDHGRPCPPELEMGCIEYSPFRGQISVVYHDLSTASPVSIRPPAGPRSCVVERSVEGQAAATSVRFGANLAR